MTHYFETKEEVAQFVRDGLAGFEYAWPWTMTITQEKSEGYSVSIVTDTSSDDTDEMQVAQFFSQTQVNT